MESVATKRSPSPLPGDTGHFRTAVQYRRLGLVARAATGVFQKRAKRTARNPTSDGRRRGCFRSSCGEIRASGENPAPEDASRTESRREPASRRRFFSGGPFSYVIASITQTSASFPRRRTRYRSRRGEKRTSGENPAPEDASRTESRREPASRRRFFSGGPFSHVIASITQTSASFPRRRTHLVRDPVGNPPFGVISSPEGAHPQRRSSPLPRASVPGDRWCCSRVPWPRPQQPGRRRASAEGARRARALGWHAGRLCCRRSRR